MGNCKKLFKDIGYDELEIENANDTKDITENINNQEKNINEAIKLGCDDSELLEQEKNFCEDVKKTVGLIETEITTELSQTPKNKSKLKDLYLQKQEQISRFKDSGCK